MKTRNKLSAKLCSVLFFGASVLSAGCSKESDLMPLPNDSLVTGKKSDNLKAGAKKMAVTISSTAYYAEKSLPVGYVRDGSRDYTTYLQSAISNYKEVVLPPFPVMVNANGLRIGSNKIVTFPTGAKLILKPTADNSYDILKIDRATNVTVNNAVIVGDRFKHLSTGGRMGMGIGVYSSSYVTLINPKIYETYGDGIYIGRSSSEVTFCKNPRIVNAYVRKCARNGISIVSSDGLKVEKAHCLSNGFAGFLVEGNYGIEEQKNITISDVTTELSGDMGLAIGLSRAYASWNKTMGTINIINHKDISATRYAFKVSLKKPTDGTYGSYSGTINVTNPIYIKPGSGRPNYHQVYDPTCLTYISTPKVQDASGTWLPIVKIEDLMDLNIRQGFCQLIF